MSHSHSIYDTDKHFIIDPISRSITVLSEKLTLIQYDHNCERYTFEIPRMIEGHDMSECSTVEIHFDNISKDRKTVNHDFYTVVDLTVSEDDSSVVIFSWLISEAATQLVGKLRFSIHFECFDSDGVRTYGLNTSYFDKVIISDGVSNTENLIVEHSDFVARMETLAEQNKETIEGFARNYEQNVHYEETVKESTNVLMPLADALHYMTYQKRTLIYGVDDLDVDPDICIDKDTKSLIVPVNYSPESDYDFEHSRLPYLELELRFSFEAGYTYGSPNNQYIKIPLDNLNYNSSYIAPQAASGIICFTESIKDVINSIESLSDDLREVILKSLLSPSLVLMNFVDSKLYLSFENKDVYSLIENCCYQDSIYWVKASLYKVEYCTPKELAEALDILNGEVV